MEKATNTNSTLTRGDKAHKKIMDKIVVFKDILTHGLDSFTLTNKQTLDSYSNFYEKVSKSQESERCALYEIIKSPDSDDTQRKEANARLGVLDHERDQAMKNYTAFSKTERDKTYKNITGSVVFSAVTLGLISNKQVRQMTGKLLTTVGKNITMK